MARHLKQFMWDETTCIVARDTASALLCHVVTARPLLPLSKARFKQKIYNTARPRTDSWPFKNGEGNS